MSSVRRKWPRSFWSDSIIFWFIVDLFFASENLERHILNIFPISFFLLLVVCKCLKVLNNIAKYCENIRAKRKGCNYFKDFSFCIMYNIFSLKVLRLSVSRWSYKCVSNFYTPRKFCQQTFKVSETKAETIRAANSFAVHIRYSYKFLMWCLMSKRKLFIIQLLEKWSENKS